MRQKRPHIIDGNKTTQIPKKHLFVDTETYTEKVSDTERTLNFKLGWALLWNRNPRPRQREFEWYYIEDIHKFWVWLDSKLGEKERITWWAHNTDFDWRVLDGYRKTKEFGYTLTNPVLESGVNIATYRKSHRSLHVLDTFNFFKVPLKELGESMGIHKGEVDFEAASMADLKTYCKQDVTILYETVRKLIDFVVKHDLGSFKRTAAGQAFAAYRHRFMPFPIYVHTRPKAINLERQSYRGGRCEALFIGDVRDKHLHYLDVNSMYPYVMQKYDYPNKLIRVLNDVSVKSLKKITEKYHVIADINFTIDVPAIAVKTKRLIFPIGVIDACVCSRELSYILKHGVVNKIRTVALYDTAPIFKDYVTYFYNLKKKYKKEGNKPYLKFTKLMLNSLYGKIAQNTAPLEEVADLPRGEKETTTRYFDIDTNRWATEYHFNDKVWLRKGKKEGFDTFTAIASEVTANARMLLWEYITIAGCENVYYMDTDSLMVNDTGYENLKEYIDSTEIGMLGVENTKIKGIYGAKWYETDSGLVLKGIKKNAVKIGDNTFKQQQFERFKTGIKKGDMDKVRVKDVVKVIKKEYNKGVVTENGRVIPYVLIKDNLTANELRSRDAKELLTKERAIDKMKREEKREVKRFMKESDNYEESSDLTLSEEKEEIAKKEMTRYMF